MLKGRVHNEKIVTDIRYGFYLTTHPMDGFWDLKNEGKGSLKAAFIIVIFFFLSVLFKCQLTAWQFNETDPERLNVWKEFFTSVGPYALWCISAWCVTSLMEGQGTMKDIVKAIGYSLIPIMISNFIGVIVSNLIVERETLFYSIITNIGLYWTFGLIFLSVVSIHQYTVTKSIFVTLLSIVGMLVLACLGILLFYLVQQLVGFGIEVFKEFSLRIAE